MLRGNVVQIYDLATGEWTIREINRDASTVFPEEDGTFYLTFASAIAGLDGEDIQVVLRRSAEDGTEQYALGSLDPQGETTVRALLPEFPEGSAETVWKFRWDEGALWAVGVLGKQVVRFSDDLRSTTLYEPPCRIAGCSWDVAGNAYWIGESEDTVFVWDELGAETAAEFSEEQMAYGSHLGAALEDGSVLLADRQGFRILAGGSECEWDFAAYDLEPTAVEGLCTLRDGKFALLEERDGRWLVLTAEPSDVDLYADRAEIRIAGCGDDRGLQNLVARYNRQNPEVRFVLEARPVDLSWEDYMTQIQLEISSGQGPDLISDLMVDVLPWAERGYLLPLDDIVDAARTEGEYFEAAFEGGEIGGISYGVPYAWNLYQFTVSEEFAQGSSDWNLEIFEGRVEESGVSALSGNLTAEDIVFWFGLLDTENRALIDWERRESHLEESYFVTFLEFAKRYGAGTDGRGDRQGELDRLRSGEYAGLFDEYAFHFFTRRRQQALFAGEISNLGFPRADGGGGYLYSVNLYARQGAEHTEEIKAFLRYMLSEEGQEILTEYEDATASYALPLRRDVMEELFERVQRDLAGRGDMEGTAGDGLVFWNTDALSEEELACFWEILNRAKGYRREVLPVSVIVSEELGAFLAGEKSAEETARIIDSRVQLYLDENR